jgi:hypothetical protein
MLFGIEDRGLEQDRQFVRRVVVEPFVVGWTI